MAIFSLLNHLIDFLISPVHQLDPVPQLVLLSLVSTLLLLFIFKKVSNQESIKLHKNKIFGNFLEIAIYRDQFRRSLICQGKVMKHNLLYLKAIGTPLMIIMFPMILVCLQLEYRLGYQVLKPGTAFIIEAQVAQPPSAPPSDILDTVTISTSESVALESPAMRIPNSGQIFWQARIITADTTNAISLSLPGSPEPVVKNLAVDNQTGRFTPESRKMSSLWDIIVSGEDPIPPESAINSIRITYAPAEYRFFQWTFSPIIYFFILTLLFGLAVKPFMKVNI
ncbi:MAG: hypothetical protein PHI06_10295 [Desulfobulbaceae bacterium]|nr:hypothetical protein [Desulfobulbaceae bacterium]